jgi:hypothetical protein
MARFLLRLGGLGVVAAIVYLAAGEAFLGGADRRIFGTLFAASGMSLAGGLVAWVAGRVTAGLVGRSCPRCGRRVARGRVYCEDHLREAINEYRDRQREREG